MKKIVQSVLFVAGFLLVGSVAQAQTTAEQASVQNSVQPNGKMQVTTIATVNLYDLKIISQDGNKFKVGFSIFNRENVQPQVIYAVQLVRQTDKGSIVMDEKIFSDDVLSLGNNETANKEIDYIAPAYLSGKYNLAVKLKNSRSLSLGSGSTKEFSLSGSDQGVEILNDTCSLSIDGDSSGKKYTLGEGVSITKDENLIANCEVASGVKNEISAIPKFKTFLRSTFGDLVSSESQVPIIFKAGEKKQISFKLPKASKPQAYDVALTFLDAQQKQISNSVAFHYVLGGASATIQNLRLDKDYYFKGEKAQVLFSWSGSADSFPGSRTGKTELGNVTMEISIKDSTGNSCIDPTTENINSNMGVQTFSMPIIADCINPKISVSIKDSQGNILDKNEFTIASKNVPEKTTEKTVPESKKTQSWSILNIIILVGIVLLVLIVCLAFFYWAKKRKASGILFFLFFKIIKNYS